MRNNKIFFHIKQVLHWSSSNLSKLRGKLLLNSTKEFSYSVPFPDLQIEA